MPKISLGVDIGLRYIKLVYAVGINGVNSSKSAKVSNRAKGAGDKVKILRYSTVETPDNCFNDEEISNPIAISQLINEDIKKIGTFSRSIFFMYK
jgi:Tfp pilus assembly PilM family ATPase